MKIIDKSYLNREINNWNHGDDDSRKEYITSIAEWYAKKLHMDTKIKVKRDNSLESINAEANGDLYVYFNLPFMKSKKCITVSNELLGLTLDELNIKYLYRLIGHEIGHFYYRDTAVFTGINLSMSKYKFIEELPNESKYNSMRILHALKESRADIVGIQLAKEMYPLGFQTYSDIKESFIISEIETSYEFKTKCREMGYPTPEERINFCVQYFNEKSYKTYMAQDMLLCLLIHYGVKRQEFYGYLQSKIKAAKLPETRNYYLWWYTMFKQGNNTHI